MDEALLRFIEDISRVHHIDWILGRNSPSSSHEIFLYLSLRVRQKQNKYPILFLTQGISDKYPELMDIRCQTTQIAMSFAQSENILVSSSFWATIGIYRNVHTSFPRLCLLQGLLFILNQSHAWNSLLFSSVSRRLSRRLWWKTYPVQII